MDFTIINTREDSKLQDLVILITVVSKDRIVQKVPLFSTIDFAVYFLKKFGNSVLIETLFGLFGSLFESTNYNSYRFVQCQELLDVHMQHEISYIQEPSALKTDSSQTTYCVLSSCYYLHTMEHISWTDGFSFCDKPNQHLLAINSDFEARAINNLMKKHHFVPLSTVVFLNLKKSRKVCI